jgi:hypothetical protein
MILRGRREIVMDRLNEIFRSQGLPEAGSVGRCRKTNSLWRVMEREVWRWVAEHPERQEALVVPSFSLSFWRIENGVPPGVGQMLGHLYRPNDNACAANWEIVTYH